MYHLTSHEWDCRRFWYLTAKDEMSSQDIPMGSMVARYSFEGEKVGFTLLPRSMTGAVVSKRPSLTGVEVDAYAAATGTTFPATTVDPLVQIKLAGTDYAPGFSQGRTLRNAPDTWDLCFSGQQINRSRSGMEVRTALAHPDGWCVEHVLSWRRGAAWVESRSEVTNSLARPISLELFTSFSLGGISPFASEDAPGRLRLHRFRSVWSMEGRMESRTFEELQLEPSWAVWGARSERFGVAGSMPCNGYFPCALVEDAGAGVVWGVQIAHNASWQFEIYRKDDAAAFSGGLADREFGHWSKTLAPGESFVSPPAFLTCVRGDAEEACAALVAAQDMPLRQQPRSERSLPVVFNEWATTWGRPSHDNMVALAAKLRGLGIRYLVMDAGWYAPPEGEWNNSHGDWKPRPDFYPQGVRATADAIRKAGFVPGIWFEMETCGRSSQAFQTPDLLLHRDGRPLTVGDRRFLDLRSPYALAHWETRVLGLLKEAGFGYLKVDYNESTGIGADGAESPGEAQRQVAAASCGLFAKLREELPDLVIENCSSGGHRIVPPLLALTAMSSFSDAHECPEIPIIAANLHRLIQPAQSQIWAVIRSGESKRRTIYSLAATFLGRMCLSGDALAWTDQQRGLVNEAIGLYGKAAPIIRSGRSFRHGSQIDSYRHPKGWQGIVRTSADRALVVAHTFAQPGNLAIPLPRGEWDVEAHWGELNPQIVREQINFGRVPAFAATILILHRRG